MNSSADQSSESLPQTAEAWARAGAEHMDSGRTDQAEACYRAALELHPDYAEAHFKLGNIFNARRQFAQAEACYRRAIDIAPDYVKAHYNLGNTLRDQSRPDEAEACFRHIAKIDPGYTAASNNLGVMLLDQKRYSESEACFRSVLAFQPHDAMALNNLGLALVAQERMADAELAYRAALQHNPNYPNVLNSMGVLFHAQGRLDEAEAVYRRAIQIKPDFAEALGNLGVTLKALDRLSEAETCYRAALGLLPAYVKAYNGLGIVLKEQGRLDEAEAAFQRALDIDPDNADACNNVGIILADQGRPTDAIACFRRAVKSDPDYTSAHTNLLFHLNYFGDSMRAELLESERLFGQTLTRKAGTPHTSWLCPEQAGRLRVGFVSGDFKNHPVAYFLEPILAHLDADRLELVAYANHRSDDEVTARLRARFSIWRSITDLSDPAVAQLIHSDGVHLLIDLSGHTTGNRLPVFARKPAPIQISWLGYFATTGVEQMDYVLATETEVPAEARNRFTESIWYLPETRLCFKAPAVDIPVEKLPALRNGFVTFGCFQTLAKITDDVLRTWAEILAALPRAHLRFQHFQLALPTARADLTQRMEALHIDPFRVSLYGGASREFYLATHNEVDIILDTFPYPGGTTTCEALWMGVPTLTLAGGTMTERQGASLLTAAGLADWVARTRTEYVAKAVAFANDPGSLSDLRSGLRQQVLRSPLFDAPRFARHFEQALWQMWLAHQSSGDNHPC